MPLKTENFTIYISWLFSTEIKKLLLVIDIKKTVIVSQRPFMDKTFCSRKICEVWSQREGNFEKIYFVLLEWWHILKQGITEYPKTLSDRIF